MRADGKEAEEAEESESKNCGQVRRAIRQEDKEDGGEYRRADQGGT